jgi:hypothetical protein
MIPHQDVEGADCDAILALIADANQALKKVAEACGEDMATQVFGTVVAEARLRAFCHHHGVKQIHCGAYFKKIQGKQRPAVAKIPPAMDH